MSKHPRTKKRTRGCGTIISAATGTASATSICTVDDASILSYTFAAGHDNGAGTHAKEMTPKLAKK